MSIELDPDYRAEVEQARAEARAAVIRARDLVERSRNLVFQQADGGTATAPGVRAMGQEGPGEAGPQSLSTG